MEKIKNRKETLAKIKKFIAKKNFQYFYKCNKIRYLDYFNRPKKFFFIQKKKKIVKKKFLEKKLIFE